MEEDSEGEGVEVPVAVAELAQANVPTSLRGLRCCKRCGLIKTYDQFHNEGCENCPFLVMEDSANIERCTSAFFDGQAAIMDPRESWAAKWLRVDAYVPGVYAISVTGQFPREIEEQLENMGRRWRCRPPPK
mmetsp:Transcript_20022/g.24738  ORF Transcript_20022/g.24738 Transcript_20022/m.24738 type:complete len:132 (-) Transcript_20022:341-736(-)|eukprot:CAMPEP_0172486210 /NCGR_PEP_ID=MMETSP1066-20121228/14678_1 /TAXON_ID=671091 /ORGANISM="Coscinodiscus wailesii, Strain CCMP2513" /LENGTH=131 /DNA_ID=CAMNT_0013252013 /DNA_START=147 /DNA_END=542 /DNA_ORIENTATION=+